MDPLTLFSWGYWGWGNCTPQLVEAVDAVEAARGFEPPLFVDIRVSRSVRAAGFNGNTFAQTVGGDRYLWLDGLGNLAITSGGAMRLKDPAAAGELLKRAQDLEQSRQRVIFFCACELPCGESECHRVMVSRLVLDAARRAGVRVRVVEWPGGDPVLTNFEVEVEKDAFGKLTRLSKSVPVAEPFSLAEIAGAPWYSVLSVRLKGSQERYPRRVLTGPARYKGDRWVLPKYDEIDGTVDLPEVQREVEDRRRRHGLGAHDA